MYEAPILVSKKHLEIKHDNLHIKPTHPKKRKA